MWIADSPKEAVGGHDLWYQGVILGSLEHYEVDQSAVPNQLRALYCLFFTEARSFASQNDHLPFAFALQKDEREHPVLHVFREAHDISSVPDIEDECFIDTHSRESQQREILYSHFVCSICTKAN